MINIRYDAEVKEVIQANYENMHHVIDGQMKLIVKLQGDNRLLNQAIEIQAALKTLNYMYDMIEKVELVTMQEKMK